MGDDLEVIPETFKAAAEARHQALKQRRPHHLQDQGEEVDDGRLAAPVRLPNGFYSHTNPSIGTLPDFFPRNPNAPHLPLHPRLSFDSMASGHSPSPISSVYMPRRVESIMGDEDRRKYHVAQSGQREAGGAYLEGSGYYNEIYGYKNANESSESVVSSGSYFAYPGGVNQQEHHSMQNYHVRKGSSSASSSSKSSPEAPADDPSSGNDIAKLSLPEAAHVPGERSTGPPPSGRVRSLQAGRSPLGRMSYARTADPDSPQIGSSSGGGASGSNEQGNTENDDKTEERYPRRL